MAPEHPDLYAYVRELAGERILVLLNLTEKEVLFKDPRLLEVQAVLLKNSGDMKLDNDQIKLGPYECIVAELT